MFEQDFHIDLIHKSECWRTVRQSFHIKLADNK